MMQKKYIGGGGDDLFERTLKTYADFSGRKACSDSAVLSRLSQSWCEKAEEVVNF